MAKQLEQKELQENGWNNPAAETNDETEIDLAALAMRFLEKIHWILLAAFVCAALAGAYVYFLATPVYEATSKIYIVGSESAISLSDLQIGTNLAADYQEVFKNWHVHELVDQRLGLNYTYNELRGMLTVSNPSSTHVIYITIKSTDPEEAKVMADTYADVAREFIAAKMDIREPNVFEEALMPTSPVSPKKTRTIAIGFLLGMIAAMAVVTVNFIVDDRITTSDEIAKVGSLPTLGLVPVQDLSANNEAEEAAKAQSHHGRHSRRDDNNNAQEDTKA